MVDTWVTIKATGERVLITGVTEDMYRIFIPGNNMRYDWVYKHEIEVDNGSNV